MHRRFRRGDTLIERSFLRDLNDFAVLAAQPFDHHGLVFETLGADQGDSIIGPLGRLHALKPERGLVAAGLEGIQA